MHLVSPAFTNNGFIPKQYTCEGKGINPPLFIENVPVKTKSLVLIVLDPDAPVKPWTHWILYNIPANIQTIPEGETPPSALSGMGDFGDLSYGGPCPPSGTHRYEFTLYALNTQLNLPQGSKKEDVLQAMKGHILEQTTLTGLYKREQPLKGQQIRL